MFDLVRMIANATTRRLAIAGRVGQIYGQTRPSASGVHPIEGALVEDYAVNVHFESLNRGHWLGEQHVRLLSRASTWTFEPMGPASATIRLEDGSIFTYAPTEEQLAEMRAYLASGEASALKSDFPTEPLRLDGTLE